jgi:hypothetical protein
MLAVKGYYKNGRIELIEPIPDFVSQAELHIIIVPIDGGLHPQSEDDFKVIGLSNFFETEDDKDVDWNKFFKLA